MSSRVTRSSARLAAAASNSTAAASNPPAPDDQSPPPRNRKRKASSSAVPSPAQASNANQAPSTTRTKRQRVTAAEAAEAAPTSPPASRRRASRQSAVMAKQGYPFNYDVVWSELTVVLDLRRKHRVRRRILHKQCPNHLSENLAETRKPLPVLSHEVMKLCRLLMCI